MSQLGERIKSLRKQKRLKQSDIAKTIGKSSMAISYYERGTREPDAHSLKLLADLLDTTTDYLLGATDNPNEVSQDAPNQEAVVATHLDTDYENLTDSEKKQIQDFIKLIKNQKK
ncbi:helix-turn-helix domain-containing protein [Companilactobacillus mishanensis]|uniref:Helix-turn-helix transcriptional regulator n=1 Tax=Companilactobacillus mishanensis TaxID=2486008 RepID=A0A5P0ZEY7_9LACO|nr:helix-turn-helix transcriptional regulator [Companilactobacillus mishanensis]MQS44280.1 helix-turn-helix transcriptional regulator [Companilactobacillus mishanensis]MQS51617.1 helix-turn-helix transcriptional regulator [Companilactobacillus mishanensis]